MFVDGRILTAPPRDRLSPGPRGVRTHKPHRCFRGYTLFSTAFGDTEYLIDMNGMVVHTWPVVHSQLAEILPNGRLMADNYFGGLEELTPDGQRVWSWEGRCHHDFCVVDEETIVFLIQRPDDPVLPGYYAEGFEPKAMASDVVVAMNRKHKILWEFPFREHVEELHELAGLPLPVRYTYIEPGGRIVERKPAPADWAHCNTIEVLPDTPLGRRDKRFRAGNLLFSFRALDIIGVADVEKNAIVWAWGLGTLDGQHQPTMTPPGTILVFDNGTARGYSAAVEIDPWTEREVWRYEDRAGFFSPYRSGVQRLPNGNTLVAESDAGRIFEVTPDKEVVWDYYSPFLGRGDGNQGLHVYRATRCTEEQVEAVLAARKDEKINAVGNQMLGRVATFPEALKFYRDGQGG